MDEPMLDGKSVQDMVNVMTKLILEQGVQMGLYPSPFNSQAEIDQARADLARYNKYLGNRTNPLKTMGYDREWPS